MSNPTHNPSIPNSTAPRTSEPFEILEDPPAPPPMQLFFPTLPNVRVELVTALQQALAPVAPTVLSRAPLQVSRFSQFTPLRRSWSLESASRQMHYDYETRSWHRVSLTISRSQGQESLQEWASRNADSPEVVEQDEETAEHEAASAEVGSVEVRSVESDETAPKTRKRDRIRRLGTSILQKMKHLRQKDDHDDKGPRRSLRRALSMSVAFASRRRAGR